MISSYKKINSREYKKYLNKGRKKKSFYFNISFIQDEKIKQNKFSVIISKKIAKTAVLRHKNKRIIYKIISQIYPQFLEKKYIFIFIKKDISKVDKNELKDELIKIITL